MDSILKKRFRGKKGDVTSEISFVMLQIVVASIVIVALLAHVVSIAKDTALEKNYFARDIALTTTTIYAAPGDVEYNYQLSALNKYDYVVIVANSSVGITLKELPPKTQFADIPISAPAAATSNTASTPQIIQSGDCTKADDCRPADEVPIISTHDVVSSIVDAKFKFLKDNGYSTISLKELEQKRASNEKVSKKIFALTVDDGYADAYTALYPLLKKYDFKATLFVITGRIGGPGKLTVEQLKEMKDSGLVDIQSHTDDMHPSTSILPGTVRTKTQSQISADLIESRRKIQSWLGTDYEVNLLAWPFGGPSDMPPKATTAATNLKFIGYGHIGSYEKICQTSFPALQYRQRNRCELVMSASGKTTSNDQLLTMLGGK